MPINRGLPSAPQKPAALAKLRSALQNMQHALNLMAVMRRMGTSWKKTGHGHEYGHGHGWIYGDS
ncbi:MAG: hypothetical protein GY862_12680 [Gammaproteobacteria bacterium]|nr:hypothetical protein [Gammaproteobacteria bacterium]